MVSEGYDFLENLILINITTNYSYLFQAKLSIAILARGPTIVQAMANLNPPILIPTCAPMSAIPSLVLHQLVNFKV